MRRRLKAYLAGPDVFLPDVVVIGERKKELCHQYGFEGLFPFDNEISPHNSATRVDRLIYRANVAMMRAADFGIFNLTPFRGPSADVGTVFELGMFIGLDKPAFGYTNDPASLLDRVKRFAKASRNPAGESWRDALGMSIEDFGNADNLMIDAALAEQGHPVIRHASDAKERFRDLTGFELCLRRATEVLSAELSDAPR